MMIWFKVEKVDPPSEESPAGEPVRILYSKVMEKDDKYYYRLFGYDSRIKIYPMHNYFIARQYAYDERTVTEALHAEYRLTLTDKAKKIVNELLSKPFECYVTRQHTYRKDYPYYKCRAEYSVYIPDINTDNAYQGRWDITVYIEEGVIEIGYYIHIIPFNCGPLRPAWERAVECWVKKMTRLKSKRIELIKSKLLQYQYLHEGLIPKYSID